MSVPPTKKNFRQIKYRSTDSVHRSVKLWNYLILTLGLDLLLFEAISGYNLRLDINTSLFDSAILIILAAILIFFMCVNLSKIYLKLKEVQKKIFHSSGSLTYWVIAAFLVSIPLIEIFLHLTKISKGTGAYFGAIVAIISIYGFGKEMVRRNKARLKLVSDNVLWIEQANRELYALSIIPLVIARLFSAIALIQTLLFGYQPIYFYSFLGVSLLSLFYFRPTVETFMDRCPKCAFLTSIVVHSVGSCPACNKELLLEGDEVVSEATLESKKVRIIKTLKDKFGHIVSVAKAK